MSTLSIPLPREDVKSRINSALGMVFFIGSWTMSFGTLFLAFLVLRRRIGVFPPEGIALPNFPMATVATLVLIASSLALHRAVKNIEAGKVAVGRTWFLGLALGLGFTLLQAWLWLDLMAAGSGPGSGLYESLFFGLTWIHALHIVIGLLSLLWAWYGLSSGRYGTHRSSTVSNIVVFWHFVDVVWIVLYLAFFIF